MELAGGETVVPSEVVEIIQADVAITAKILRICNSAYYGFAREVGSLEEAGNRLGVNTLVNLVLTACSGSYFKKLGTGSSARCEELWQRSVSNALAASLIARIQGDVDKNSAYTVGLLQDIGEIVIDRFLPKEAAEIHARALQGDPRTELEKNLLGEDHAQIGARLAEQWNFPGSLIDAIRSHHSPGSAKIAPELACAAHLADSITNSMGAGDDMTCLTEDVLRLAGLDAPGFQSLEEQVHSEIERAREILAA